MIKIQLTFGEDKYELKVVLNILYEQFVPQTWL